MAPPGDLDALSPTELKARVLELLGKVAALEQTVAAQRAEIARPQRACMGTSMSRFEFSGSVPPVLLGGKTVTS